jgi:putative spermidine/putrescine transport system ATP-binding protein
MALLEIENLHKAFSQYIAVHSFNIKVDKGEFVSFLGPSGCGKTTTLRMIAGFEQPTSGSIRIGGAEITNVPANRRNIGMVFQSYALFPNMTVANNIKFGLKIANQPETVQQERLEEMLRIIHMEEFAGRYPHQLSGGQQQRVALARALAMRPQVLLLDEPLSALDAKIRVSLRQEIRSIQRQLGITTIYVTHDQEEALSISDRIVVMSKGNIEQIGTPTEIYNTPATRFVASFVGTLNVLDADVQNSAQKQVLIDGQPVSVTDPVDASAGQTISVAIRPEAIRLKTEVTGSANRLRGTVNDVYFLGSVVRVHIQLEKQFINMDMFNDTGTVFPRIGESVELTFAADACRVLKQSADAPVAAEAV